MERPKVVHLSSAHPPFDPRIFHKEARSLADAGYEVTLVVPHLHDEEVDGVRVKAVRRPTSRIERMLITTWRVFRAAYLEHADIYHFHDPELIPAGLVLKLLRKRVIYDVHEAYAQKILSKDWIFSGLRLAVSQAFALSERLSSLCFDQVVTADSFTAQMFYQRNVTILPNYPFLDLVKGDQPLVNAGSDKTVLVYAGQLTRDRGLHVMLDAVTMLKGHNIELHLLGKFENREDEELVRSIDCVKYHGLLPVKQVYEHLFRAHVGLVLLQPVPAYFYAGENTTKLFEYMACGLPIVASDLPRLKKIVDAVGCGVCVNPRRPDEIARALMFLIGDPQARHLYGRNGRNAVLDHFNWESQSGILFQLYSDLLENQSGTRHPIFGRQDDKVRTNR